MPWQAVGSGRYERPIDVAEKLFVEVATIGSELGKEHWAFSSAVQIEWKASDDLELALRKAWKALRFVHPELACEVTNGKKIYQVPTETQLEVWLDQTCIPHPPGVGLNDLLANYKPTHLARIHLLPSENRHWLAFETPHWRTDGVGSVQLLSNLLKELADPREVWFGDEPVNLSASFDEAALLEQRWTPASAEHAQSLLDEWMAGLPSAGLPIIPGSQPPANSRTVSVRLPIIDTATIIAECQIRKVTVSTAIHAAVAIAVHEITANPNWKYTSLVAINLRPWMVPPYDSPKHAVQLYLSGKFVSLDKADFDAHLAKLKPIYGASNSPEDSQFISSNREWPAIIAKMFRSIPPEGTPEPTEPQVNSLGLLERHLHDPAGEKFELTDFWIGVQLLTKQVAFYNWTFRGQLNFCMTYNEAYHTEELLKKFGERVHAILMQNLAR